MFTIKMFKQEPDGRLSRSEVVSCHRYSLDYSEKWTTIFPRGVNDDSPDSPVSPLYTITPLDPDPEKRMPYRFDLAYIENGMGKTIDRIGPFGS
jgi:hypothetical protein